MYRLILTAIFSALILIATACGGNQPETVTVIETRIEIVQETVEVPVTVEVPIAIEVTRLVEVTSTPVPVQATREPAPTATPAGELLSIGDEGRDGSQIYIVSSWQETPSIPLRYGGLATPPEGGKFIVVTVDIINDGRESIDIYCRFDWGRALFDDRGRQFDDTGRAEIADLYAIEGNVGCNDMLQPGFSANSQTIPFLLPVDAIPAYVMFWDPNELPQHSDSFGDKSAVRFRLN